MMSKWKEALMRLELPSWMRSGYRSWSQFWLAVICLVILFTLDIIDAQREGFELLRERFALYAILLGVTFQNYKKLRESRMKKQDGD